MAYTVPPWVNVPDPNNPPVGAVPIDAPHLSDMGQGIVDASLTLANAPLWMVVAIWKDPTTGFWPSGWDASGNPIFTSGSASSGVRPTARNLVCLWIGPTPDPAFATTSSSTDGFRQGRDIRLRAPGP